MSVLGKVKKIKFFNKFLVAFSGKQGSNAKIILKEINKDKHFTLKLTKDGFIDFHETIEGKNKIYIPHDRIKIDFEKFGQALGELLSKIREIDVNDPSFNHCIVVIPRYEDISEVLTRFNIKGKEVSIEEMNEETYESFVRQYYHLVNMKDVPNYNFKMAFVRLEGKLFAYLYKVNSHYLLLTSQDFKEWKSY